MTTADKMKRTSNKTSRKNLFSEWIGEGRKPYTSEEKFKAGVAFMLMIALSLLLTSGTRVYNFMHFMDHESGFLPDSYSYQVVMFLMYASLSTIAIFFSYLGSRKTRKKLMLGATLAGAGISGMAALIVFLGTDFLTLNAFGQQAGLNANGFVAMYKNYFAQYGQLYMIPAIFALVSFGVKGFYRSRG